MCFSVFLTFSSTPGSARENWDAGTGVRPLSAQYCGPLSNEKRVLGHVISVDQ